MLSSQPVSILRASPKRYAAGRLSMPNDTEDGSWLQNADGGLLYCAAGAAGGGAVKGVTLPLWQE
jgi:hypothetical protein